MSNHYDTLGISKTATQDEIKKAYRKLAMQHHPDRGGDEAKFKAINEANDVLGDPQKRATYDAGGRSRFEQFEWNSKRKQKADEEMDMNDIWSHINRASGGGFGFGSNPYTRKQQTPLRNRDLRVNLQVNLVDTLEKHERTISLQMTNGVRVPAEIELPRGLANGAVIRYAGCGDNVHAKVSRGDLYVTFLVTNPINFQVSESDLITSLQITCFEAILGCTKEVVGLDKKKFSLTVPPGTQHNSKLRIRDQGLYSTDHAGRGSLIVNVETTIPTTLTDDQREIIRKLQDNL